MNNQLPLTTEEVLIQQVSIDVKVIRIGKKQMTLSVFRQLQQYNIADFLTGELIGVPWGKVNYHNNCITDSYHVHIIWQTENQLRQDTIYVNPAIYEFHHLRDDEWRKQAIAHFSDRKKTELGLETYNQYMDRYYKLFTQLEQLDQLFIAV